MSKKKYFIATIIAAIFLSYALPHLVAERPYIGAYLSGDVSITEKILFECNYYGTNPVQIPSGKWLYTVSSVAGANGVSTLSGYIYQNGFSLWPNSSVGWHPQTWLAGQEDPSYREDEVVGNNDYLAFYGSIEIDIGANEITHRAYVYDNDWSIEHDAPIFHYFTHIIPSSNDRNLLVGKQTLDSVIFKHFQVGIESNSLINETSWRVMERRISFHNGTSWEFLPGYVCHHDSSAITYRDSSVYGLGEINYDGTNIHSSSDDSVTWKYTGNTIDDNYQLWTGSGTPDMVVYKPFLKIPSWYDDFNDNSLNTFSWEELEVNGGTVSESSQRLRVYVPSGTGWAQAGYVTKWRHTIDNRYIEIDLDEFNSLDEMILMICTTKTTDSDPIYESNWYRCVKTRYGGHDWVVQKKVNGVQTNLQWIESSGEWGTMTIAVDDDYIRFYEDGVKRYEEEYELSTYNVYIYIFSSSERSRGTGTDYMDDFKYQPE